jgi:hypothetical protein
VFRVRASCGARRLPTRASHRNTDERRLSKARFRDSPVSHARSEGGNAGATSRSETARIRCSLGRARFVQWSAIGQRRREPPRPLRGSLNPKVEGSNPSRPTGKAPLAGGFCCPWRRAERRCAHRGSTSEASASTRLPRSSARRKIVRGCPCEVDAAPPWGRDGEASLGENAEQLAASFELRGRVCDYRNVSTDRSQVGARPRT